MRHSNDQYKRVLRILFLFSYNIQIRKVNG
jgi:hypothetical protein